MWGVCKSAHRNIVVSVLLSPVKVWLRQSLPDSPLIKCSTAMADTLPGEAALDCREGGGISFGRSHGNVNSSSGVRDGLDNGVRERGVGSNA